MVLPSDDPSVNGEKSTAMDLGITDQYESNPDYHLSLGSEAAARFAANAFRNRMRRLT